MKQFDVELLDSLPKQMTNEKVSYCPDWERTLFECVVFRNDQGTTKCFEMAEAVARCLMRNGNGKKVQQLVNFLRVWFSLAGQVLT